MSDIEEDSTDIIPPSTIEWKDHHNEILIDWADKAACYRWLHVKSGLKYTNRRNLFTIPVIIMSTLTGTANFSLEKIPDEYRQWAAIGIGSINLLAGIITTISQFLKVNELVEAHRVAAIAWDKFYRNIRIELIKCPTERTNVLYVLKGNKDEFDRLMETSPDIDEKMLNVFFKSLTQGSTPAESARKKVLFDNLQKPQIFNEIESIRNSVYKPNVIDEDILQQQLSVIIDKKKVTQEKMAKLKDFITGFKVQYNRTATAEELATNVSDVTPQDIQKILSEEVLTSTH